MKVWIFILLAISAWLDIRKKQISLLIVGMLGISGIIHLIADRTHMPGNLLPIGFSVLFIGLSIFSKEGVGMGDALLILALAMNLRMQIYFTAICISFFLAGIWALGLLVLLKRGRKSEMPLVPFLLLGYTGGLWLCM